MEPSRKFKIIVNSKECGICSGSSPSAVAKKVVKKLCGSSSKAVKFSLKECKRGCERECGPYQGRMEKLDRPYKRGGKTITHLVVCGKVRKMKGGALSNSDFKREIDNNVSKRDIFKYLPNRKLFFFGSLFTKSENNSLNEVEPYNVEYNNKYKRYYRYAIFFNSFDKSIQYILELTIRDNNFQIEDLFKTSNNTRIEKLKEFIKKNNRIMEKLKEYLNSTQLQYIT